MLPIIALAQEQKDIIWMHGLNGEKSTQSSLQNYSNSFNNASFLNLDESHVPRSEVRTANSGVEAISNFVRRNSDGNNNLNDGDGLIYVGHSLGGMIGKELDIRNHNQQNNGLNMVGVITLGSPLSGAKIANSLESKYSPNWVLGYGSPVNRLVSEVFYNLGRPLGLGHVARYISNILTNSISAYTLFFRVNSNRGFLSNILPVYGNTWHDLKKGHRGHAHKQNVATETPKLHLWGNIERPVTQTMEENNGFGGAYRGVVRYTEVVYNITKWVPGLAFFTRNAAKSNAYFNYTLHGRYANIISDGVTYSNRKINVRTKQIKRSCWEESRRTAKRSCRKWGWFRWLCRTFVRVFRMIVCTIQTYFYDHEVWFKLPHYPNSDGVVSEYSATAQGQRWQGTGIEVPQTDHNELVHLDSNAEVVLNDIFNGLEGRVPRVQRTIFNLNE
jgi:hypothetical protein